VAASSAILGIARDIDAASACRCAALRIACIDIRGATFGRVRNEGVRLGACVGAVGNLCVGAIAAVRKRLALLETQEVVATHCEEDDGEKEECASR
jgi:hypothetical protein